MGFRANGPATAAGSAPQEHGTAADAPRPSVAVIGAGVSGLTAAYLLSRTHDVTLFEAEDRLGGHAHTHDVTDSDGRQHAVDSGFIVHNDVTYPWLRRLFGELDVEVRPTEMSMSIRCEGCGLEYAGGRGLRGVFAQPRRLIDPRFLRMLWQVKRFHRRALAFLRATDDENLTTYGEFLEREGFSGYFVAHYAVPVVSCVWSAGRETTLVYPARYLFRFLDHHGMLRVGGSPQWYTVAGGSRTYVERLAGLLPDVRASHPVTDVTRGEDGVQIRDVTGRVTRVDRVVIATHADQALGLLTDPERRRGHHPQAVRLLAQRHRAAHRQLGPAGRRAGPGLLELPDDVLPPARSARRGELLDEPAPGAPIAGDLPRHAQRPRASRPGAPSSRRWTTSTRSTPPRRSGRNRGSVTSPPTAPCTPAPTTGGDSTRTAAAPASRPPGTSG